jgi:hypothetical protein
MSIHGVRIYNFTSTEAILLFEKKYDEVMTTEQLNEAQTFYQGLSDNDKQTTSIQIYTECTKALDNSKYMSWAPITINDFISSQ